MHFFIYLFFSINKQKIVFTSLRSNSAHGSSYPQNNGMEEIKYYYYYYVQKALGG